MDTSQNKVEHNDVLLKQIENCFSNNALIMLQDYGIFTLKELFEKFSSEEFVKHFNLMRTSSNQYLQQEILGTVRLLRCKYLNEDPILDFACPEQIDIRTSFGFSARVSSSLSRMRISAKTLFDMAEEDNFESLYEIRNINKMGVAEVSNKVKIIYNFYKNKEPEDLQFLLSELKRLIEEDKKITNQIEDVQKRIEHRLSSKGGFSKWVKKKS